MSLLLIVNILSSNTEITTSTAVMEMKLIFIIIGILLSLITTNCPILLFLTTLLLDLSLIRYPRVSFRIFISINRLKFSYWSSLSGVLSCVDLFVNTFCISALMRIWKYMFNFFDVIFNFTNETKIYDIATLNNEYLLLAFELSESPNF